MNYDDTQICVVYKYYKSDVLLFDEKCIGNNFYNVLFRYIFEL